MKRRAPLLLTASCVLFILLWTVVPPSSWWVERVYSRTLYRGISALVVPLADLFPFSLSATLLCGLPVAFIWLSVRNGRRLRRRGASVRRVVIGQLGTALSVALVGYTAFIVLWGANYGRSSIETKLSLDDTRIASQDVLSVTLLLTEQMKRDLPMIGQRNPREAVAALRRSVSNLVAHLDGSRPTLPRRVKRLPAGSLMRFGSTGIASPFLLEAHVDGALTEPYYLFTAAHELAHTAGFAGEADADLIAALAGMRAGDPYARYATALVLFEKLSRKLSTQDYAVAYQALPTAALADLADARQMRALYRAQRQTDPTTRVSQAISQAVYDVYLRAQGVEAGLADYGRVVTLFVAAEQAGWVPTLERQAGVQPPPTP